MPQPGVPSGPRNTPGRRRPKKTEVAGPYRSQSSNPKIRSAATKREHRKAATPPSSTELAGRRAGAAAIAALKVKPLSAKRMGRESREAARTQAAIRRALAPLTPSSKRSTPKVPTLSAPGPTTGKSWSPGDPLELAVEKDVIQPLQREGKLPKKPTVGQEIYGKIAEWGPTALTLGPELKAASTGLKATLAGVESEGVTLGAKKALGRILAPRAVGSAEGRAAVAARTEEKAAARTASGVRAAAKRTASRVTRSGARTDAKVARGAVGAVTRREAAAAAGAPLKLTKAAAGQTLPVVQGHERALLEHPKTTLQTTARALPGLVTAPVGAAASVGVTAGRTTSAALHAAGVPGFRGYTGEEILAPVAGEAKAQLDFAQEVARTITASDPKEVQEDVEQNLGLMLPIMLGLGTKAGGEKITKGRVTDAVRRITEQARERVGRGAGRHDGSTPRIFERSGQRKREAVRTANARNRIKRETHDRTRDVRAAAGKARGSEVVREGVLPRGRLKRTKGDLKIHTGDLVGFVVRHALPMDKPREALAEVKRIKGTIKPLPDGMRLAPDSISTRDVIAFIERNPSVLADRHLAREVTAYKKQARYARETPGLSPEHSERARFTSTAITRGVPLPEERFPQSIRDEVRAPASAGQLAKDVLRREAKSDRQRAKRLRRKATVRESRARIMGREAHLRETMIEPRMGAVRARAEKVKRLEARRVRIAGKRQELRDAGSTSKRMTQYRRALRKIDGELQRLAAEPTATQTRVRLQRAAEGNEAVARRQRTLATDAAALSKRKHAAATEIDPAITDEFIAEMRDRLRREGKPDPEYVHTGKAREAPTYGATGAKLTQFPGRSKFRRGSAEAFGLVREDLPTTLRESIARPVSRRESYKAMRGFLEENEFRAADKSEWTSDEARALFEEGVISRDNYVLIPRQLYKRAFSPEEWAAHLKLALDADPKGELKAGRQFKIVRRPAAKEFFDQMGAELVSGKLAAFNRATSFLILGTSPAWAAMQVVAEYSQASIAQPRLLNPAFVRKSIRAYHALAPEKRQALDSWVGVTSRALEAPGELKLDLATGDMQAAASAYGIMNRTPLGRLIKSIPQGLRDLDQWKGGRIRVLTTAARIDQELNGRTARFLSGIRGLHDEMGRALKDLQGKPLADQMAYVAEHPKLARRYQDYLDDVMGNWSALTKNERVASQLMIFYPFMRMSLRWTFYAFPKRHPVKAAMLYYLGQQNANELKRLLGHDPSFYSGWANVPLHLGPGETELIPLSRIAPGSNALIEALGEDSDRSLGTTALRVAQPAIVAAITAATGVVPLTGKQEPHAGINALAQLLTLSPIGRVANEMLVPDGRKRADGTLPIVGSTERQESLDKLFAKLNETKSPTRLARSLAAPVIPRDLGYERDLVGLSNILDTLGQNSSTAIKDLSVEVSKRTVGKAGPKKRKIINAGLKRKARMEKLYSEASNELDGMFGKYGVPYKKESNEFMDAYGQVFYGSKPDVPYGTPTFGAGGEDVDQPKIKGASSAGPRIFFGDRPPPRQPRRRRREPAGPRIVGPVP